MASIHLDGVAFAHSDACPLFSDVTLCLTPGWHGLVGANGAGKTTLLALIAGARAPDDGRVRREPAQARVVTCAQEVETLDDEVRVFAAAMTREAIRARARLGLDPDALARWPRLSPGERKRWQLAAALDAAPDVLLLDEPTNHLDGEARGLVLGALARFDGVGVVVSHDRALLDGLTESTLRLHRRRVRRYPLPYSGARALWEAEASAALDERARAQANLQRVERRLDEARRQAASASRAGYRSARQRNRHDSDARTCAAGNQADWAVAHAGRAAHRLRAEATRAVAAIAPFAADPTIGRSVFFGYARAPNPRVLALEADALCAGTRTVLREVALAVGREDRVRVTGGNGAGKTTLLAALVAAARLPPERLLYLPQELGAAARARLLAVVGALDPATRGRVLSLVAALGVDPDALRASACPSPGEARKLALALGLGGHAWALVLDEPTNHLDLPAVERLEAALALYPGALVLVTHDDALAAAARVDRAWRVADGRVTRT